MRGNKMGLSNKQFGLLLLALFAVMLYGGIAFEVADKYGKLWGVLSLTILNSLFFIYMIFSKYNKHEDDKDEK
jgi:hypothetical protein